MDHDRRTVPNAPAIGREARMGRSKSGRHRVPTGTPHQREAARTQPHSLPGPAVHRPRHRSRPRARRHRARVGQTSGAGPLVWSSAVVECKNYREPVVIIGKPREKLWRALDHHRNGDDRRPHLDTTPGRRSCLQRRRLVPQAAVPRDLRARVENGGFMGNPMVLLERNKNANKPRTPASTTPSSSR